jgi:hypothetical protein
MLFQLKPRVTLIVLAVIALFSLGLLLPKCHAAALDAPYVQLSGGEAVVRGQAPVLDLTFTEPAPQLRKAYWQESLTIIGTSTFQGRPVPNNFMLRGLFVDGFGNFDVGLGVAWVDNYLPYNGQHVNFALQLAYRFALGPTLTYAHVSDAGTTANNLGRDMVLLGWRFH